MGAFSVFFTQSPSFLAHQRRLLEGEGRSNCRTLFKMTDIPRDNQIRAVLDDVEPSLFHPVFEQVACALQASGGLSAFLRLGNHVLIALDGTEYHRSTKIHCPHCSTVTKAGKTEYFHSMVQASIVAPGHDRAVPLQPEFIAPQDGSEKQNCESRAGRRWLAAHGATFAHLNPIYLGDDLYSCQPICEAVLAVHGHFLFICKPQSHPTLSEYLSGVELDTHVETIKRGKQRFRYTYLWMCDLPLRDGEDALRVNWLSIEIADANGKVTYRNSFVTDLPVDRVNVVEIYSCIDWLAAADGLRLANGCIMDTAQPPSRVKVDAKGAMTLYRIDATKVMAGIYLLDCLPGMLVTSKRSLSCACRSSWLAW
jgi:hypothetical protein